MKNIQKIYPIIASMGLEALDKIKSGAKDAQWTNEKLTVLKNANQVHGETELSIIPEIDALISQQMAALANSYSIFS